MRGIPQVPGSQQRIRCHTVHTNCNSPRTSGSLGRKFRLSGNQKCTNLLFDHRLGKSSNQRERGEECTQRDKPRILGSFSRKHKQRRTLRYNRLGLVRRLLKGQRGTRPKIIWSYLIINSTWVFSVVILVSFLLKIHTIKKCFLF